MNKRYRLVFNRALRVWQVASELAARAPQATATSGGRMVDTMAPSRMALALALGAFGWSAALAAQEAPGRIIGDAAAPRGEVPIVLQSGNGVPVVNIAAPSAAGVSRNRYGQFDVGRQGAILNNARAPVQTELGGWVQGNPWLAGGAKVILNEVNGPASQLQGYVEVAGQRAEVVIANPAGIQVDGGGFLNASRVTLTSGTPVLGSAGALEGYRVAGGVISVAGKGLDTSRVDYTELLTRSLQVNAGMWARELQARLGAQAAAGSGDAPAFALDVGALGGMYAGKIALVGTEQGLGVRNAGAIGAQAGELVVTFDGRLENRGSLQSQGDARISAAGGMDNAGVVSARGELGIRTPALLDNSGGTINAARLQLDAQALRNRGGAIEQTGAQALALQAGSLRNRDDGRIGVPAAGTVPAPAAPAQAPGQPTAPTPDTSSAARPQDGDGGQQGNDPNIAATAPVPPPLADGVLNIATVLDNDAGRIAAGGALDVSVTQGLDNSGGQLSVQTLRVRGADTGGASSESPPSALINDNGRLSTSGALDLDVARFSNRGGSFLQQDTAASRWRVRGQLDNSGGRLASNATALSVDTAELINADGRIEHAGVQGLQLRTQTLAGAGGSLTSNSEATLELGSADNRKATLTARSLRLSAQVFDNRGGSVQSTGSAASTLSALALDNSDGGRIAGNGDLLLQASRLNNAGGSVQHAGSGTLRIESQTLAGSGGSLQSNGSLELSGGSLDLGQGMTVANTLSVDAENLSNAGGRMSALAGPLALQLRGTLDNRGGQISSGGGASRITAQQFDNAAGTLQASGELSVSAKALDNTGGTVALLGPGLLGIDATTLVGRDGRLQSEGALVLRDNTIDLSGGTTWGQRVSVRSDTLINAKGSLSALGEDALQLQASTLLDNSGGLIGGNGALVLDAGTLDNRGGTLQAGSGQSAVSAAATLDNRNGKLLVAGPLRLSSDRLDNGEQGLISSQYALVLSTRALSNANGTLVTSGAMDLQVREAADNSGGMIQAGAALVLSANGLLNQRGQIIGQRASLDTRGQRLDNEGGTVASLDGALDIASGELRNRGGLLQSQGEMKIATGNAAIDNRDAGGKYGIRSTGALTLSGGALDNRGGVLSAGGDAQLTLASVDNSTGGLLASTGAWTLTADSLRNAGGKLQAGSVGELNIATTLDNQAGLLAASDRLVIHAGSVDNRQTGGDAKDRGVQGGQVQVSAESFDNRDGRVLSDTRTELTLAGTLDNTGGEVATAGEQSVLADAVRNRAGTLLSGNNQRLQARMLDGEGTLSAGGDATVVLREGLIHSGAMDVTGTLALSTDGDLQNRGVLRAGNLDLRARNIDNTASGQAISQSLTAMRADEQLSNRGLIDGATTDLQARTIDNIGSGRLYGDSIALQAQTLRNRGETVDGVARAATIAARQRLALGVGVLENTDRALIYSAGNAALGGTLDAQRQATGNAQRLRNIGSTIDVAGNLVLSAGDIENIRPDVVVGVTVRSQAPVRLDQPSWRNNGSNASQNIRSTSNYSAWEVYYLRPEDILEDAPYITPDGYAVRRAVIRLTPQTSAYFFGRGGLYRALGERSRLAARDGTVTIYYSGRRDNQANPDKLGSGANDPFQELAQEEAGSPAFRYVDDSLRYSSNYGTCTSNCVQLWTQYAYDDPTRVLSNPQGTGGGELGDNEQYRIATRTVTEDVLQSAGPEAVIQAGGTMQINVDRLRNEYARIAAGGELGMQGLAGAKPQVTNLARTLYRTYTFNNVSYAYNGTTRQWGNPSISQESGRIGAGITSGGVLKAELDGLDNLDQGRAAPNVREGGALAGLSPVAANAAPNGGAAAAAAQPLVGGDAGSAAPQTRAVTAADGSAQTIASGQVSTQWPGNSLFKAAANGNGYLVETDPAFANFQQWLGSDYLLRQLGQNGDTVHKRLGDGFYEQKLVREQIGQLTGRRFLAGYTNDEAQYRALLDAGARFAKRWNLRPGVALSAEQMAQLTDDMVWLVEKTVTLPDGSTTTALVPQVYVRLRPEDLDRNGALLAGEQVDIRLKSNLRNTGTIAGRQQVSVDAANIDVLDGGRINGQRVALRARDDVRVLGGKVKAVDALTVKAGGNVTVASTVATEAGQGFVDTQVARVGGLYVSGGQGGVLLVDAGKDATFRGAQLRNDSPGGVTQVESKGSIIFEALQTGRSTDSGGDAGNFVRRQQTNHVGTTLDSAGSLTLIADKNINLQAARLKAGTTLGMRATGDINSTAVADSRSEQRAYSGKNSSEKIQTTDQTLQMTQLHAGGDIGIRSLAGNVNLEATQVLSEDGGVALIADKGDVNITAGREVDTSAEARSSRRQGVLSSTRTTERVARYSDQAVGSLISGRTVDVLGNNIAVEGSQVVSEDRTALVARRNVSVVAAQNRYEESTERSKQSSGLFSDGGVGFTLGKNRLRQQAQLKDTTNSGSLVGSVNGKTTIWAGEHYQQTGSDVIGGGGVQISGKTFVIENSQDRREVDQRQEARSGGLHVSVKGGVADAATAAYQSGRRGNEVKDGRLKALYAA
ncbi:MAG TPA: filamentous hemagglutinin N-terminal domain-containing protein, partial [Stenotrophomonas sp.]|nr:filamentous hemagglutinin N-terminal domain-containing protein [Stenotrophomonas sp.]